jgi:hypothetical protein
MIVMRIRVSFKWLFLFLLLAAGCDTKNDSSVNVAGHWTATITVQSCSPSDVCTTAGFTPGQTVLAIMDLRQSGNRVDGTYTYQGLGINATVSGNLADTMLVLNGEAQHPLGRASVHLTGTVSDSGIASNVSHNISVIDGRSGTVGGTGNFTK